MASRIINMTVPEELIKEIDKVAKAEGRTRSGLFREAARRYVQDRGNLKKNASPLLSRLRALATRGPDMNAQDIDQVIYRKRKRR